MTNEIYKTWSGMTAKGLKENIKVVHAGLKVAKNTRDEIENLLGESIITKQNKLNYQYVDEKEKIANKN